MGWTRKLALRAGVHEDNFSGRRSLSVMQTVQAGRQRPAHGAPMSNAGSAPGLGTNFCVRPY